MYLKQADLFWGMSQNAIQIITKDAVSKEFQQDEIIFNADDPADYFYVLIQGKVRMELQDSGHSVYSSDKRGEIFGWSALIGRRDYSATVISEELTMTLKFNKDHVNRLLDQDNASAAIFYKQLACAIGNRLLKAYDLLE
jgi:CRP-like cAMP-binding protein